MMPEGRELRAGFGRRTINAPVGTVMDGPRAAGGTTGCHDDLFVRALWLEQGTRQIALIGLDLLYAERHTVDRLKGAVSRRLGLRADEVLLNFSHTHAPPAFSHWAYGNVPDHLYIEQVEAALVEALTEARSGLQPARLFAGQAQTRLPVSRRRPNASGQIEFRPNPQAEVCTALPFFLVKDARDAVLSLVFSASCHPSIIFLHDTSADYPGAAVAALNGHFGTEGGLFLQGAGGDAKPRQIVAVATSGSPVEWRQGDWHDVEAAGQEVAAEVIARAAEAREVQPDLRVFLGDIAFPLCAPPACAELDHVADPRPTRKLWVADMKRRLDFLGRLPASAPVALHAVRLGDGLRLIGLEAEVTGEVGDLILRHFPMGVTFPLGYTNGTQFYLPSDKQLAEGGYETESCWEYHWPANLAPGIDARISQALARLKDANI
jgi:hypothetical protein